MDLYYETSDGQKIDLMNGPIYAISPETLTGSTWEYSTISGVNGLGRVKRFYKDAQERKLTVGIMADTKEEFNTIMYGLHRAFERDVRRLKPGKLWWNDFYKEVYAVDTSQEEFEEYFESINRDITFMSVYPYWIRQKKYQYFDASTYVGTHDFDDYDFEYDYDHEGVIEIVDNDCIDAANFEIIFYGPAQNPNVTIGGHMYEVLTDLEEGEYVIVNSLRKTVRQYNLDGTEENIFYLRGRDQYIFEPIPSGNMAIERSKDQKLDVIIYDERGEPDWI